ncbi:MAG: 5-formyltetrahydrofolate cyclo-ligase [Xenococcaceae cyanobacterium MO_167.B27]|nr:5-formyltetrahydrofolate cyclo-ligase [Xenococcaceae cyanobacterium MO_167.B27]
MLKETKSELRQRILAQRKAISLQQWQKKNQQICDRISGFPLFQEADTVLAYFSFRQEPDISHLFTTDKKWGFPACVETTLVWHFWQHGEPLQLGKYGIKQPLADAPLVPSKAIDLILVPTVACDCLGYRLGYGGGYYDRLLSSAQWQNIPTLGIVFDFACVPQLPTEPWDIKLNYICTESLLQEY